MVKLGLMDPTQKALIAGISQPRMKWLSGVPIEAIAEIRERNENVEFRQRLEKVVRQKHDSTIDNAPKIAVELCQC